LDPKDQLVFRPEFEIAPYAFYHEQKKGHPELALVCERHIGVGISIAEIQHHNLPLPSRDMIPVSIEEQLICYSDKFFSKNGNASGIG
jgi:hypothetical protein